MKRKKILVVGELNVDMIFNHIDGFPAVGKEIVAKNLDLTLGSSSAIFASNISTLGIETSFCGKVGTDTFGKVVLDTLSQRGVDVSHIIQDPQEKTGVTMVMNYDQDRANITYCGAMEHFGFDDIPWERVQEFDHVHFSNLFLQPKLKKDIAAFFQKIKSLGLSTSLDLQTDPDGTFDFDYQACLPFVDIFLPNESEIKGITKESELSLAIEKVAPHAKILVVKMGERGCLLRQGDLVIELPAMHHTSFVDAIGAGDSFNAGFIHHFLSGEPIDSCLEFANLTGAVNTTASGGTSAFGSFEMFASTAKKVFNIHTAQL
ncbi:carbohydrate kinase family protein [Mongoliitalea daihaiensis]|uniref:carbohydrate kinase family protein n=1 Tax=Mongoliitalea daihaiensis TaxID=2782006 RepID=UPI001F1D4D61|nr:carbohydrate kinase family protein [Mongoliitalea daihaiensis]UJP66587.1 carbohydrate kinase family protein [Mongoliitalea daihaiensis]